MSTLPSLAGRHVALIVTVCLMASVAACSGSGSAKQRPTPTTPQTALVAVESYTFHDTRRPTVINGKQVSNSRTLATLVLFPEGARQRALPLVVFAHGFNDSGPVFLPMLRRWAAAGYVVAAPTFPATTALAPGGPDLAQGYQDQPADVSFVLDQLLRLDGDKRSALYGVIDARHIAVGGHSLGAVTVLGLAYNTCCRDRRIDAVIPIAGLGLAFPQSFYDFSSPVPALFVEDDADPIYEDGLAVYRQAPLPKFLLTLKGAGHRPFDGQWDATIDRAVLSFLDRYLKVRDDAIGRLQQAPVTGQSTLIASP